MFNEEKQVGTMDGWEDLQRFRHVNIRIPAVKIGDNGSVLMNKGFIDKAVAQVGKNEYILLSFSRKKKAIVLDFTNKREEVGALKLTRKINIIFSIKKFCKANNIDLDSIKGRYFPVFLDIPKVGTKWVIFLDRKVV